MSKTVGGTHLAQLILESNMKKNKKNLPEFIIPQKPFEVLHPPESNGRDKIWIHEIKFDGIRLQVHIEAKKLKLYNQLGVEVTSEFPTLSNSIMEMQVDNAIMEGEAVILDKQGKSQYQQLQKALRFKEDMQVKIFFFDLLFLDGEDMRKLPLLERKTKLQNLIPDIHPRLRMSNHVTKDPESFFNINCKQQLEGIVSKIATAPYESGRSKSWCKTRCSKTSEFHIAGLNEETQEIILGEFVRDKLIFVGKVYADGNYLKIKKKVAKLGVDVTPFEKFPQQKNIHWVKPEVKAEINFSNWTDEKRLRNPTLVDLVT